MTTHRKYDHETKVRAARAVVEGRMTKPEAMEAFDLKSKTQIDTWCRLYREGGPDALFPKPKGRPKKPGPAFSSREEELELEIQKRVSALADEVGQGWRTR
ncbi:helix-turn-helix domain-containing protein [Adlercreutzia mucosicola]|uniref:helix-turn-helix domain-containing protein n=1 Tax=Adlercreutzia mucosicola TaxID=580026 RepID=UPI000412883E|nr:helix-turn-helix domain-containing protein [Adlercreutzia mucosicola]MCR2035476.1 helix-turn-helix domain containing protein [Adlercreutzia mucosicola]